MKGKRVSFARERVIPSRIILNCPVILPESFCQQLTIIFSRGGVTGMNVDLGTSMSSSPTWFSPATIKRKARWCAKVSVFLRNAWK